MGKLRVLDLFSGIGGFSLGLERTGGFETVAFCEIEEFPRKVLAKHWPDVPCFQDVRKLRGKDVGSVDVICGGYPCQPFSTAGQRRGKEDDRHLWPEFSRLVAELRPAWVIGENVAGHISMGLDDVLSDLEGQGYACRTFVIPACAVDAPHRRDRVWTVGHAGRHTDIFERSGDGVVGRDCLVSIRREQKADEFNGPSEDVAHPAQLQRNGCGDDRQQGERQVSKSGIGSGAEPMADANGQGPQGRAQAGNAGGIGARRDKHAQRHLDSEGWNTWEPEPQVGRVAARLSPEMDGDRLNDRLEDEEGGAKGGESGGRSLRGVRSGGKFAEASPRLQQADRRDRSLPDLPRSSGHIRWNAQNQADEALQFVWNAIHANTQQEAQSMQREVSVRNGPSQRFETLEWDREPNIPRVASGVKNRVDRLKALGNAVVPQIPEMIGRAILEAEHG